MTHLKQSRSTWLPIQCQNKTLTMFRSGGHIMSLKYMHSAQNNSMLYHAITWNCFVLHCPSKNILSMLGGCII